MTDIAVDWKKRAAELEQRVKEIKGKKIAIIGDVGIDEYIAGPVSRVSPEAPVPVVEVSGVDRTLGLSANVAQNVKSLGGEPFLLSVVGQDDGADELKAILTTQGISTEGLVVDSSRPTTRKIRVMSGQHHLVRVDFEEKSDLQPQVLKRLLAKLSEVLADCDGLILQDYAKGVVSVDSASEFISLAKKMNKWVLVDPYRSTSLTAYKGATFMTPNRDESLDLARQIDPTLKGRPEEVNRIGEILMQATDAKQMVVTLGPLGMKIFEEGRVSHLPTFAKRVFDVTGAGDTVISAMALGLAAGLPLELTGVMANLAAGVVVGKVGCAPCEASELSLAIKSI